MSNKEQGPTMEQLLADLERACAYADRSVPDARAKVLARYAELERERDEVRAAAEKEFASVMALSAERDAYRADAERLDFLESLMKRRRKFGWQDKEWPLDTDLHINPLRVALYARSGIGSDCDFSASGKTVRETIDAAIAQRGGKDA